MGYGAQSLYQPLPEGLPGNPLPQNPLGQVQFADPSSYQGFVDPGFGSAARMSGMGELPLPAPPALGGSGGGFFRSMAPEGVGGLASRALPVLGGLGMYNYGNNFAPSSTQAALLHGGGLGMMAAGAAGGAVPTLPFAAAAATAAGNSQLGNTIGMRQADVNAREGGKAGAVGQGVNLAEGLQETLSGNPTGLGHITGALGVQSPVEAVTGALSHLPGVGGLFNKKSTPDQPAAADTNAQSDQLRQAAARTPEAISATMTHMGITPDYQKAVMADYQSNVAYLTAQSAAGIPQQVNTQDPKDPTKTIMTSKVLTPDEVSMAAYQDVMAKIPAIAAQQQSDADMTRRSAAVQAAIAQWMPQVNAPYQAAAAQFGPAYQATVGQMAPGMRGAAQNFANVAQAGNSQYAGQLSNAMSLIPGLLAQQQHDSQVQQLQQQLIQSEIQRQIAAGKAQQTGSGDAIANALTGS